MSTTTPGITRVGQIGLRVRDLEAATAFYRDVLGLKHLFTVPNMAFFDAGNMRLMLGLTENNQEIGNGLVYFQVPDIQAAEQALRARGVEVISGARLIARMPDHDLWLASFRDCEGNAFELMSEVRKA